MRFIFVLLFLGVTVADQSLKFLKTEWPAIIFPFNYELNAAYYTLNEETDQIEPYLNTTFLQFIDADNNRGKIDAHTFSDALGMTDSSTYFDYNSGMATVKVKVIKYCEYTQFMQPINL